MPDHRPVIGITCDVDAQGARPRAQASLAYIDHAARAGGLPVLLPPDPDLVAHHLALCDAIVLTGGDDPDTAPFGEPIHPRATRVHPRRQAYETALLAALPPERPTLGVCLGMQMMALVAGGRLDQHLPDSVPQDVADAHQRAHPVTVRLSWGEARGEVRSRHHQAVADPGRLRVVGRSPDGVIEAIDDPARPFYLGVQWHPEDTAGEALGIDLFRALVEAARRRPRAPVTGAT